MIESALDVIGSLRPIIYLELHGCLLLARGRDLAVVISNLRKVGYKFFQVEAQWMDDRSMADAGDNCRLACMP